jgi:hypothetical protein
MKTNNLTKSDRRLKPACLLLTVVFAMILTTSVSSSGTTAAAGPQTSPACEVQIVRVTADTIARLPQGKPYVVDLTRTGVAYDLDSTARTIDFSRIVVRTRTGEVALTAWLKERFPPRPDKQPTRLAIGATDGVKKIFDLNAKPDSGTKYECSKMWGDCFCKGFFDCASMLFANVCRWGTIGCGVFDGKVECSCDT